MFFLNLFLYIASFILIWIGAGLIVSSVGRFSRKLRLSQFAVSFVLLGLLTSTPEFAVGLQSVAEHKSEIFVGNLLGGIFVIFLFVIPVLAILGNGINVKHELDNKTLLATLGVILAPVILLLDHKLTNPEGVVLILLYFVLLLLVEKKHGIFDKENTEILNAKAYSYEDIIKILAGVGIVFMTSSIIVGKTLYFAQELHISAFYISLIAISIGTNLPELSLAVRSVFSGKKDIAMGDYLGSAAANTLLFGVFTLLNEGEVITTNNFTVTFFLMFLTLSLFYVFARSDRNISRAEGFILLSLFLVFGVFEYIR